MKCNHIELICSFEPNSCTSASLNVLSHFETHYSWGQPLQYHGNIHTSCNGRQRMRRKRVAHVGDFCTFGTSRTRRHNVFQHVLSENSSNWSHRSPCKWVSCKERLPIIRTSPKTLVLSSLIFISLAHSSLHMADPYQKRESMRGFLIGL